MRIQDEWSRAWSRLVLDAATSPKLMAPAKAAESGASASCGTSVLTPRITITPMRGIDWPPFQLPPRAPTGRKPSPPVANTQLEVPAYPKGWALPDP